MSILAGNWKLFKVRSEVESFFKELGDIKPGKHECYVAPSPTLLETACRASKENGDQIKILSQNVSYKTEGAFTGETSPQQLLDLGVVGSLVAHSERRQFFGESDGSAAERCRVGLDAGLKIVFCVGENLDERRHGRFESTLDAQLSPLLSVADGFDKKWIADQLIVAYEPVWAIGTGVTASTAEIESSHKFIAEFCEKSGYKLKILYGGSVKPDNFGSIAKLPNVFGGLVGGASLAASSYRQLLDCLTGNLRSLT